MKRSITLITIVAGLLTYGCANIPYKQVQYPPANGDLRRLRTWDDNNKKGFMKLWDTNRDIFVEVVGGHLTCDGKTQLRPFGILYANGKLELDNSGHPDGFIDKIVQDATYRSVGYDAPDCDVPKIEVGEYGKRR